MPTAPYNPRRRDEEDDADVPMPDGVDEIEVDVGEPAAPAPRTVLQRPQTPDAFGPAGIPDGPNLQTRRAVTKAVTGQRMEPRDYRNIAQRQGVEAFTPSTGQQGMDAPDLQVRSAAIKAQLGAPMSNREIDRVNTRQRLEAQQGNLPPERSVSTLLAGSRLDPRGTRAEQAAEAKRKAAEEKQAARTAEIQARRDFNSKALADYKAKGIRYYTDPADGRIRPVVDEKNRVLHFRSDWEDGEDPQGRPAQVMRDEFGQRQFRKPTTVESPDVKDDFIYAKMKDGTYLPYMPLEEAAQSPDFYLKKQALGAIKKRNAEIAKERARPLLDAEKEAELAVSSAQAALAELESRSQALMGDAAKIDDKTLRATEGGVPILGWGAKPTADALREQENKAGIDAQNAALEAERTQLLQDLDPSRGRLKLAVTIAKNNVALEAAKIARDAHLDQRREILARLEFQGKEPGSDPQYLDNERSIQAAEAKIKTAETYRAITDRAAAQASAKAAVVPAAQPETPSTVAEGVKSFARGALSEGFYAAAEGGARMVQSVEAALKEERGGPQAALSALIKERDALSGGQPTLSGAKRGRRTSPEEAERLKQLEQVEIPAARAAVMQDKQRRLEGTAGGWYADQVAQTRDIIRKALPVDQKFAESTLGQIAQGAGQLAGTLPLAFTGAAGPAALATASFGQIYQEGYDDAIASGADPARAHQAALQYLPAGALDALSNRTMVGKALKPLIGKATVRQIATDVLKTAAMEGATEGTQQGYLNAVAKVLEGYDPEREFDEEVLQSIVVGAVLGGGITAVSQGAQRALQRDEGTLPPPEDTGRPSTDVPPPTPRPITAADAVPAQPTPDEANARLQAEAANDPELAALLAESEPVATAPVEAPAGESAPAAEVAPAAVEPVAAPVADEAAQVPEPTVTPEPATPVAETEPAVVAAEATPTPSPEPPVATTEITPEAESGQGAPASQPTQAEDYARYQAIQREWADLRKSGVAPDSEQIRALWAENEEIKNRHGGMPPEEPKAEPSKSPEARAEDARRRGKAKADAGIVPREEWNEFRKARDEIRSQAKTPSVEPTPPTPRENPPDTPVATEQSGPGGGQLSGNQTDPNIGRTWNSRYGKQTITGIVPGPSKLYSVITEDTGAERRYSADSIEDTINKNEYELTPEYAKEQKERNEIAQERKERDARQAAREKKELDDINAFTAGDSPMAAGKKRDALLKLVSHNGTPMTRKRMIERSVEAGSAIRVVNGKRELTKPDGSFLAEDATTKAGMDYAAHLIEKRSEPGASPAVKEPTPPTPSGDAKPPAQMKRPELRAELRAAGVESVSGAPLDDANAAQLMAAVGKLRRGQLETPATPTTDKLLQRLQDAKKRKIDDLRGKAFAATEGLYRAAEIAALDIAILAVRAGRPIEQAVRMAIARFKARYPAATPDELSQAEASIRGAINEPPPPPKAPAPKDGDKRTSRVGPSMRKRGVPIEDMEYDARAQDERMKEAQAIVTKDGPEKAEAAIENPDIAPDTRVAIGGTLVRDKMLDIANAKPEEVAALTRDMNRIVRKMRPELATKLGQGIAMWGRIYEDMEVKAGIEYLRDIQKKADRELGGKDAQEAIDGATAALDKDMTAAEIEAEIERLKKKYTTKPARKVLTALQKQVERVQKLRKLGALQREDLADLVGKELKIPTPSPEQMKRIAEIADRIKNAPTHAERSRAELDLADQLAVYKGVAAMDVLSNMMTAGMLSGYTTQGANIQGTALQTLFNLAITTAANPKYAKSIAEGTGRGIPLGLKQALAIMKTGVGTRDLQDKTGGAGSALARVDFERDFGLPSVLGKALTTSAKISDYAVFRTLRAMDAVFYYPAREAYATLAATKLLEGEYKGAELAQKVRATLHVTPEAFMQARKQAMDEGYSGVVLGRRVADIIEAKRQQGPHGLQIVKESEQFAAQSTFTNEPVGLAGVAYHGLKYLSEETKLAGVPILKPWLLFLKTTANVFNALTDYTPTGFARAYYGMRGSGWKDAERRNFTEDEQLQLKIKAAVGTVLMGVLISGMMEGEDVEITGKGPMEKNKRRQWQDRGNIPYSIRIGDERVSYKDSPLLLPLAIVGNVRDAVKYQKPKSDMFLGNQYADALTKSGETIFDLSMLTGTGDLIDAMRDGNMKKVSRTLANIPANTLIPLNRLLQQIDQSFDEQTYEVNPMVASIPFARRTGTPETSVLGEPRTYSPWQRFFSSVKRTPLIDVLEEKGLFPSEPSKDRKVGNRVLTPEEHAQMRRLAGPRIRMRLEALVPRLRIMSKKQAEDELDRIERQEYDRAERAAVLATPKR